MSVKGRASPQGGAGLGVNGRQLSPSGACTSSLQPVSKGKNEMIKIHHPRGWTSIAFAVFMVGSAYVFFDWGNYVLFPGFALAVRFFSAGVHAGPLLGVAMVAISFVIYFGACYLLQIAYGKLIRHN